MLKNIRKIFDNRAKNRMLFFAVLDILLVSFSIYLAFWLRFEGKISGQYSGTIRGMIFLALFFCLPIFYSLRLYSFSFAYVSTQELISLVKATTVSFLFLGAALFLSKDYYLFSGFPRSTLFISYFLVLLTCGGMRLSKRIYLEIFQKRKEGKEKGKTLIVGAGDAGEQILRSILNSNTSSYLPVGFVDDNPTKQGEIIHGIKVLGKINDIPEIVKEDQIEEMIIALPTAGSKIIKRAVEMGRKADLKKIKIIPPITEIINGEVSIGNLKEVGVEDLLGREPVFLDTESIKNFIQNKVVLITGAAGSIGSELSRQIAKFKPSLLLLLDQDETGIFDISEELKENFPRLQIISEICDIQDEKKVDKVFSKFLPKVVFHAAAYKHVPLMEKHPDEAIKNNVFGTEIVAEAALNHGAEKLIFISSDKCVNPTSVMGATKRVGEMICQALNNSPHYFLDGSPVRNQTKFISVRFGNVLDSRGSVIPIFREQIKKGGPVKVTHPQMKRYFMTNSEACLLVMQASTMGEGGEVFVLDMGEPINILDLAKEMIRLSGFEPDKDIPIVFTTPRPGEKLFEEILTAEEGTIATRHQKIFKAKLSDIKEEDLKASLKQMRGAIEKAEYQEIVAILKKIIPSYSPQKGDSLLS